VSVSPQIDLLFGTLLDMGVFCVERRTKHEKYGMLSRNEITKRTFKNWIDSVRTGTF
jgi:hypothetical protein